MKRTDALVHWRTGVFAGLLGLALVSGALGADPRDGLVPNGPGGGVGTLPATQEQGLLGVPTGPMEPYGGASQFATTGSPENQPALALRGTSDELDALIALTYSPDGSGWFELTAPAADGTLTITYHGNVVMLLERSVLQASAADVALAVDPAARGSLAVASSRGRRAVQVLTVGLVNLPLHRAARAGLLAQGGVELEVSAPGGARASHLRITGSGSGIRIEQTQ